MDYVTPSKPVYRPDKKHKLAIKQQAIYSGKACHVITVTSLHMFVAGAEAIAGSTYQRLQVQHFHFFCDQCSRELCVVVLFGDFIVCYHCELRNFF